MESLEEELTAVLDKDTRCWQSSCPCFVLRPGVCRAAGWQELEACGDEKAKVKEERLSSQGHRTLVTCSCFVMQCKECDKALEQAATNKMQSESRDGWMHLVLKS